MNNKNYYDNIWNNKWGDMQKYGPVHRHHRKIVRKMLNNLKINTVLDVGCGEGSNLQFLKSIYSNAIFTGIDISKNAIAIAKKKLPTVNFFLLDCQKDSLQKKFDLVFCSDVLEHLYNDKTALNNIYKMTNKYCLVATVQGRMRKFEEGIGHVRNYKYGELKNIMQEAGFKNLSVIEWGFPLYSPLYRNLLDFKKIETVTGGNFGFFKKTISSILYFVFLLNFSKKGDAIFILAEK